jgi:hypothetical protein
MRGIGAASWARPQDSSWPPPDADGAILAPAITDILDGPCPARTMDPASRTSLFAGEEQSEEFFYRLAS